MDLYKDLLKSVFYWNNLNTVLAISQCSLSRCWWFVFLVSSVRWKQIVVNGDTTMQIMWICNKFPAFIPTVMLHSNLNVIQDFHCSTIVTNREQSSTKNISSNSKNLLSQIKGKPLICMCQRKREKTWPPAEITTTTTTCRVVTTASVYVVANNYRYFIPALPWSSLECQ